MVMRLLSFLIVGFWLTMTVMLLRLQLRPDDSAVTEVPVEHVLRLMFHHAQASELNIMFGEMRYGGLSIRPAREDAQRRIDFSGNVLIRSKLLPRDRLVWTGKIVLNPQFELQSAKGMFALRETDTDVDYEYRPSPPEVHYRIRRGRVVVMDEALPVSREGAERLLTRAGLNPQVLENLEAAGSSPMSVSARFTKFTYRDEEIEAYEIALARNGTAFVRAYVSQLGQILLVETPLGLTLSPQTFL